MLNPKLKFWNLGLYVVKMREPGKRSEFSMENMENWFDWRINFFGKDFTIWLEFD